MSVSSSSYEVLSSDTLVARLGQVSELRRRLGEPQSWEVSEVGDGNLNLVFIIKGIDGLVVVKQALPYVRLAGESWPLTLKRNYFEYHALIRQAKRDPGSVPEVYYFDEMQALFAMEFLDRHVILRKSLIAGRKHDQLATTLGLFCARTLFRGSLLSLNVVEQKSDLALFAENTELCGITEDLVFTDPFFAAEKNRHTSELDPLVASMRADADLKIAAQHFKMSFANKAESMLHGDLHTGSVMVCDNKLRIIDPEFVTYGPMGFDIGMLLANFLMAYFALPGHIQKIRVRTDYQEWILEVVVDIWTTFAKEFTHLWHTERTGMLYRRELFEEQGQSLASEIALIQLLNSVWEDTLGFCGIEMHRRILGFAHIAEYDKIADARVRAAAEARGLVLGRQLTAGRTSFTNIAQVVDLASRINHEDWL